MAIKKSKLPRILIVEDDQTTQLTYLSMLYGEFIAEAVDDGEHALMHCDRDYDAILMDIWLPGISGIETTKVIRKSSSDKNSIPIIGISADTSLETKTACLKAGMNAFFTKPIFPGLLKNEIKHLLAKSSSKTKVTRYSLGQTYNNICLSEREAQCSKKLIEGKNNIVIASELKLTVRTVEYYIENIRKKLDVHKREDLINVLLSSDFIKYIDIVK